MTPGERFVYAQIDPFDVKSQGAKIPDSSVMPSIAVTTNETYSFSLTTAGNQKATAFLPNFTSGIVTATEGLGGWTFPAAFSGTNLAKRADFVAGYETFRPVGHGIRLSCPLAPTSATGFVHIAIAVETFDNETTWPYVASLTNISSYPFYKRVTLASLTQTPLTIANKFVDETAFRYTSAASSAVGNAGNMEFQLPLSWGAILIAIEGTPAGSVLSAELVLHVEALPKSSGLMTGSPAAPSDQSILNVASHISANLEPTHTEDSQSSYFRSAANIASQGLSTFAEGATPIARNVVYNMGQAAASYAAAYGAGAMGRRGIMGVNTPRLGLTR